MSFGATSCSSHRAASKTFSSATRAADGLTESRCLGSGGRLASGKASVGAKASSNDVPVRPSANPRVMPRARDKASGLAGARAAISISVSSFNNR